MDVRIQAWAIACLLSATAAADGRTFAVDATKPGRVLPNPSQMLTSWNVPKRYDPSQLLDKEWDVRGFAEWVEVMAATGGNDERDCFRNPKDRSVTDDYDFSRLVDGCRAILSLGMKPYIKLGNVPTKLSSNVSLGDFGMNVRPPDDYSAYGRYMEACAKALLAAFGKEELLKWRFAVLTEYENGGWFKDASGDPERTFQDYCLLYETTVAAFGRVISPELTFGAHAMAVTEGLWDERRFLAFVAVRHLPLKFVTASFYDRKPGVPTSGLSLPKTLVHLRAAAEKAGLKDLFYGVDEGRLLSGVTSGAWHDQLPLRIVGDTYQAAYDARVVRALFDAGADYFASWGYMSGPSVLFGGVPSVSFHVAKEAAKFKGLRRLPVAAAGGDRPDLEVEAVAAIDETGRRLQVMAYSFTNTLHAAGSSQLRFAVTLPESWRGQTVALTQRLVDDRVNWFVHWRNDRAKWGVPDKGFRWSPDDPSVLSFGGLIDTNLSARFQRELLSRYREMSRLKPEEWTLTSPGDKPLEVDLSIQVNSAAFLELRLD